MLYISYLQIYLSESSPASDKKDSTSSWNTWLGGTADTAETDDPGEGTEEGEGRSSWAMPWGMDTSFTRQFTPTKEQKPQTTKTKPKASRKSEATPATLVAVSQDADERKSLKTKESQLIVQETVKTDIELTKAEEIQDSRADKPHEISPEMSPREEQGETSVAESVERLNGTEKLSGVDLESVETLRETDRLSGVDLEAREGADKLLGHGEESIEMSTEADRFLGVGEERNFQVSASTLKDTKLNVDISDTGQQNVEQAEKGGNSVERGDNQEKTTLETSMNYSASDDSKLESISMITVDSEKTDTEGSIEKMEDSARNNEVDVAQDSESTIQMSEASNVSMNLSDLALSMEDSTEVTEEKTDKESQSENMNKSELCDHATENEIGQTGSSDDLCDESNTVENVDSKSDLGKRLTSSTSDVAMSENQESDLSMLNNALLSKIDANKPLTSSITEVSESQEVDTSMLNGASLFETEPSENPALESSMLGSTIEDKTRSCSESDSNKISDLPLSPSTTSSLGGTDSDNNKLDSSMDTYTSDETVVDKVGEDQGVDKGGEDSMVERGEGSKEQSTAGMNIMLPLKHGNICRNQ